MNKLDIINKTVGLYFSLDPVKTVNADLLVMKLIAVKLCLVLSDSTEDEVARYYRTTVPKMKARIYELEIANLTSGGELDEVYYKLKAYLSEILEQLKINK